MDYTGQHFDNYRLSRLLGHGTFGDVYEATDMRRNERVAIKVMEPLKTQRDVQNFLSEVRTLVRLRHRYIIPIRDFGVEPTSGIPFIVMPYASEGSLRQRHPRGTRLPLATVVQYVKQLAEALQYAHDDRSIHRDVKPENVLLGPGGELLLSDFGITTPSSSLFIDLNQPAPQSVAGSPVYMAPEQCRGKPEKASDRYALAIIVYEWLCGKPPFTGDNPLNIWDQHINDPVPSLHDKLPTISPEVEQVVMTALAKNPKQRFASVLEFAQAFERACNAKPHPIQLGTTLYTYTRHYGPISSVAWSPDGSRIASGSRDRTVQVWDASDGRNAIIYTGHNASIGCMAWSPDGSRIASGSSDQTVQVWDASDGSLVFTFRGHFRYSVNHIAWSPDSSRIASVAGDGAMHVWDAADGRNAFTCAGYDHSTAQALGPVAWPPDGKRIASGRGDGTVTVWDASDGSLVFTSRRHSNKQDYVHTIAWSPNGVNVIT